MGLIKLLLLKDQLILNWKFKKNQLNFINIDKIRIQQVVNNLLDNAIKFSPDNSQVIVRISNKNQRKIITEIIDFGPGIPEKEQYKLFKEYQKTNIKPPSGLKGTGLGLAIAKKIINKHKGKIGVTSEIGKFTNFYFTLPVN
ncbi:MAG: ATP-binding protein [Promethearchaeota archaeon]|nr:MAG: ATP-binding protein [Candidatus Lokiarchaeota archaeon]